LGSAHLFAAKLCFAALSESNGGGSAAGGVAAKNNKQDYGKAKLFRK